MSPVRIQRKRTKGWRMPEGAVYVGRPSKWGNPFVALKGDPMAGYHDVWFVGHGGRVWVPEIDSKDAAAGLAVRVYRGEVMGFWNIEFRASVLAQLAGRDLACWCPLDQPCHADVLLEVANS